MPIRDIKQFVELLIKLNTTRQFTITEFNLTEKEILDESKKDYIIIIDGAELRPIDMSMDQVKDAYALTVLRDLYTNPDKTEKAQNILDLLSRLLENYNQEGNVITNTKVIIALESGKNQPLTDKQRSTLNLRYQEEIDIINHLLEEINNFICITEEKQSNIIKIEKIKSNLSVKDLALLFKLLAEEKIIDVPNVSSLSRTISQTFYTERSPEISPKSFKNQYDEPKQPSIDKLDPLLVRMRQNLKKFDKII